VGLGAKPLFQVQGGGRQNDKKEEEGKEAGLSKWGGTRDLAGQQRRERTTPLIFTGGRRVTKRKKRKYQHNTAM